MAAVPRRLEHDPEIAGAIFGKGQTQFSSFDSRSEGPWYRRQNQASIGWLFLLAALDFDPAHPGLLQPVMESYIEEGDYALAYNRLHTALRALEHQKESQVAGGEMVLKPELQDRASFARSISESSNLGGATRRHGGLAAPKITLPFSTVICRWDLYEERKNRHAEYALSREEVAQLYDVVIDGYQRFKKGVPALSSEIGQYQRGVRRSRPPPGGSDTQLNHDFFMWQMEPFETTGRYWSGFESAPPFRKLLRVFLDACKGYLVANGHSHEEAELRARGKTLIWASVHTGESIHQPHNSGNAMIGGVFYARVPENSGKLVFFDPRGKSPVVPFMDETDPLPIPPFHNVFEVDPQEGLLVLFPGWLYHQVRPSTGLNVGKDGYRVSFSINLDGEWGETGGTTYDDMKLPPEQEHHEGWWEGAGISTRTWDSGSNADQPAGVVGDENHRQSIDESEQQARRKATMNDGIGDEDEIGAAASLPAAASTVCADAHQHVLTVYSKRASAVHGAMRTCALAATKTLHAA
eukprot:jgi/Bigna1/75889/fgenesh1_pg.37_\